MVTVIDGIRMYEITSTVTSKGQVTIPKRVRQQLGIEAGDKVSFVVQDSGSVELQIAPLRWKDLRGIVPSKLGIDSIDFRDAFEEGFQRRGEELVSGRSS